MNEQIGGIATWLCVGNEKCVSLFCIKSSVEISRRGDDATRDGRQATPLPPLLCTSVVTALIADIRRSQIKGMMLRAVPSIPRKWHLITSNHMMKHREGGTGVVGYDDVGDVRDSRESFLLNSV